MEVPLPCSVGVPGIDESCNDSQYVWGRGEEQGIHVAVAQSCNNGGEEVRDRPCGDEAEEKYHLRIISVG